MELINIPTAVAKLQNIQTIIGITSWIFLGSVNGRIDHRVIADTVDAPSKRNIFFSVDFISIS